MTTTTTLAGRAMTIGQVETVTGKLAADLMARGWEPALYTLIGKRGGVVVCLRSTSTGEFSKF